VTPRLVTPRLGQEVVAIRGGDTNARRALATRQCQGNFRSRGAGFPDAAEQIREIRHGLSGNFQNNISEPYPGLVRRAALRELADDETACMGVVYIPSQGSWAARRTSQLFHVLEDGLEQVDRHEHVGIDGLRSHGFLNQERANSEQTSILPDERRAAPLRMRWRCEQCVFQQVLPVARKLASGDDFCIERVLDNRRAR